MDDLDFERGRPVLDESDFGRGRSGDGSKKGAVAIDSDQADFMRLCVKMDQVEGAKLAVLTMFLDCKLSRPEQVSFLVRVVFIVKESGADLAEQKTGSEYPQEKDCVEPRFHETKVGRQCDNNEPWKFESGR